MSQSLLDEIIDRFESLPQEEKDAVLKAVDVSTGSMPWVPLPGKQMDAYFCEADELFYGGAAGGGKGLLPSEKIATPFGFREIGKLKVGDSVLSRDGTATKVIGVYPQKRQEVYRVCFSDGAEIITDAPHKWNYSIAGKTWRKSKRKWKVGTTEQLKEFVDSGKNVLIPLCDPVRFTKAYKEDMRVIEPYVLGLLLGDGYTAQSGKGAKWSFSTEDKELLEALPGNWVRDNGCSYRLRGEWREKYFREFERLGLVGCKADTKFIPDSYKFNSIDGRFSLLQGLMDTDGYISKDGKAYYTSTSKRLAYDVRWLVLSLGGKATITNRVPVCTNGAGGRVNGNTAWTVYIRMPDNADIVRLGRKKRLAGKYNGGGVTLKRRITSIEPCGHEETICIAVDHPESLYIASEDFIVTHNTDLGIGLALTAHRNSLFLRRERDTAKDAFDRVENVLNTTEGRNAADLVWKHQSGDIERRVKFSGCKDEKDKQKYKGRPHDLYVFDEISDFLKSQFMFIKTWNRSAVEGQRCRVLCTGNPPTTAEGLWVIEYWAAWLDPKHPNPAKDGELRWYTTDKTGIEHEVDGRGPHTFHYEDGSTETIMARSRTFIRAMLADNPYLMNTEYGANLDALPAELRLAYRDGRFDISLEDNPKQVIPTQWILEAQQRWRDVYFGKPPKNVPMCSIGVDIAQGGDDDTVLAPRHDGWYAPLITAKGKDTPDGKSVVALVVQHRRDGALPIIDMGGGFGGATSEKMTDNKIKHAKYKGGAGSKARSKCGTFCFYNKRAEAYWRFREALDPEQPGGSDIALPDDPKLVADLSAPLFDYKRSSGGFLELKITPKEDLIKSLGRSPDRGDAVIMGWTDGQKADSYATIWNSNQSPQVKMGHNNARSSTPSGKTSVNVGYSNRRR